MIEALGSLASLLALGFVLGMRHATDADHVIAIATIVSEQRKLRGSAIIGIAWGIGHTLTILAVGGAIILLGIVIPPRVGLGMEFAVGLMLIILGVLTLTGMGRVVRDATGLSPTHAGAEAHVHAHGDYVHTHVHTHHPERHGHAEHATALGWLDLRLHSVPLYSLLRPLVVGIVHGLAGSAAIALVVLAAVRDPLWAITYLVLFGVGTIAGMMVITLALSAPFALTSAKLPHLNLQLRVASGLISFGFGLFLIYNIGFVDGGLFSGDPGLATPLRLHVTRCRQ